MPDMEKVIRAWELFRESNPYEICNGREFRAFTEPEYCMSQMIKDTITLLKEQEDEKKRIMIVIWDTLHEGLSIDTVADQDWVYERIRHQIEDT